MLSAQDYFKINREWLATQPAQVQRKYPRMMAEIEGRDPNEVQPRRRQSRRAPNADTSELQDASQSARTDFDQVARASRAVARISATRCDQYDTWIAVGMALSELGRAGYMLWDEWSKLSTKYNPTECAAKWPTFTPGDGLTLASLDVWASEDTPQGVPTDGCRPDCPNRSKLAAHQETIRQQGQEITQLRDRNQFVTNAQGAKHIKSASLRDTVVELKKELDRVPLEERQPDQFVRIRPALMATYANSSPSTVSRHLKRLENHGIIERKVERTFDSEQDAWVSETFIKPRVDLTDPNVLIVPSEHGGDRRQRCKTCQSDKLVRETKVYCAECEAVQSATVELVNPPEEAIAEPQVNDGSPLNCIMLDSSNVPLLETTTGSDLSELQDAIQDISAPAVSSVSVPSIIEDTIDLVTAIRAADQYSPPDDQGRFAYKTALAWLNRHQPIKAEALLDRIQDPQAHAIVAHLADRGVRSIPA